MKLKIPILLSGKWVPPTNDVKTTLIHYLEDKNGFFLTLIC